MLNKLRRRFAFFNGIILILFVMIVILSIWVVADKGLVKFWDKGLKALASQSQDLNELPSLPNLKSDIKTNPAVHDVVKIVMRDDTMKAISISPGGSRVELLTREIARKTWKTNQESWQFVDDGEQHIRVYSVPFQKNNQHGIIQTSVDLHTISYYMNTFMTHLFLTALVFAIIAVFLGWFLAGRALIPVQKAWQQQEEFVANAAHELRTPLTVIQTNLDVLLSAPEGKIKDNLHWLDNAYTETQQMGRLINDLLLLAQIDGSEMRLEKSSFNFSELMNEITQQMETVAQKQNLQFAWEIEPELMIWGDQWRIRQLLIILIDNAFKYTPACGSIKLTTKQIKDKVEIIVQDTGIGISHEDTQRIFDRFYRADKARSRSQGGVGLGLSIALWIIKSHRGSIVVHSELGEGSTFTVLLPLQ